MSEHRGEQYQSRFDALAASGADVHGEAVLVRSYAPHTVLDAGCGTGRVAMELDRHGITVVGVDVDPSMLDTARRRAPHLDWRLGDLATVALEPERYDVVVVAGNVLIFTSPGTEAAVVANVARALLPGGCMIAGFSLRPNGYDLATFDSHAALAGLELEDRWSTWDRQPFSREENYAVSVFRRPSP